MDNERRKSFISYMQGNVTPILVDFIEGKHIPDSVILPANVDITLLNGHYDKTEFVSPEWLNTLENSKAPILVIDKIDSIPLIEQTKFVEILKYRQVSTFELPKNVIIIVTAKEINQNTINDEIYSLVAHIKG